MAKSNFQDLLLEKGEKISIAVGIGFLILFIGLGVLSAGNKIDPEEKSKLLENDAKKVTQQINDPNAKVAELPERYSRKYTVKIEKAREHMVPYVYFDPIAQPSDKRNNPIVLTVKEFQADVVRAKIPGYDIVESPNGRALIGTLEVSKKEGTGKMKFGEFSKAIGSRLKSGNAPRRGPSNPPPNAQGFGGGGFGAPPGGGFPGEGGGGGFGAPPAMGGGGGFGAPPAMGGGPGMGGMPGMPGMGGMPGFGGMPGGFGPGAATDFNAQRMEVSYQPIDDPKALEGRKLAATIHAQRMVVLQASFPYREQLEEVRRALKLADIRELLATPEAMPIFKGIDVERRIILPNGQAGDWVELKFEENFRPLFARMLQPQQENEDTLLVSLPEYNKLVLPLPAMFGSYPEINLPTLTKTVDKIKKSNQRPVLPPPPNKYKGEGELYSFGSPTPQGGNYGELFGSGTGEGGMPSGLPGMPGGMPGGRGFNPFGSMGSGDGMPGMPGMPGANQQVGAGLDQLDYCLIRIPDCDPTIRPGLKYQYRIRVKMENPNYKKKDLVAKPSDAESDTLVGNWAAMPDGQYVEVPPENFIYAVEPSSPDGKKPPPTLKEGQALMQIQRWLPQVQVDKFKEPFGDWFVADLIVNRGAYITAKQLVNVPLWSSTNFGFILREFRDNSKSATPPKKGEEPKRGVIMDLSRPDLLVVDIDGGKVVRFNGTDRSRPFDDTAAYEVLLLSDDGNLIVHNSAIDNAQKDRQEREANWKKWVDEVKALSVRLISPTQPGMGGGNTGSQFGEN